MKSKNYVVKTSFNKTSLWKNSRPLLGRLDMELTERCNNNCIHCCINLSENDKAARKNELTTKEIRGILIEAASLGCLTVRFYRRRAASER